MSEFDLIAIIGQVGFPVAVATFLLWKSYNQDQKYLEVLTQMSDRLEEICQELKK